MVQRVRWEKRTRLFLRTTEFRWQEGHTATRPERGAEETLQMLEVYRDFVENELAVPVIRRAQDRREKFAGRGESYAIEAMMRDGRRCRAGTSHNLGQHFAKAFDIMFLSREGQRGARAARTVWGVTTSA